MNRAHSASRAKPLISILRLLILWSFVCAWPSAHASGPGTCRGAELERALSHLHDDVCPAVVGVQSFRVTYSPEGLAPQGPSVKCRRLAASGIVVDAHGCVVTTARVAQPGDSVTVHFPDGRVVNAKYLGVDPDLRIAVLRLSGQGPFPSLQMARADTLPEWVAAVAYGPWSASRPESPSLTLAQRPSIRVMATTFAGRPSEVWQIQGPFVPGNGGGALVTVDGEWLGLIVGEMPEVTGGSMSAATGLIVPADIVAYAVEEIESGRRPSEGGFLGLRAARRTSPQVDASGSEGIAIEEVLAGSPAECAGLLCGDLITHLDHSPIRDADQLVAKVRASRPGDRMILSVRRDGATGHATVTLGDRRAAGMYLNLRRMQAAAANSIELELRALRERMRVLERRLGLLNADRSDSADPSRRSGGD